MKANVYKLDGTQKGTIDLPESVFGVPFNADLVHQVVVGMQANARDGRPKAHTKDRSEVRGGGKKPWKQKGTGRARHGSIRSPIWIGGGVTHGPRKEKSYAVAIPKKMRKKALLSALSAKFGDSEILFVDAFTAKDGKTAEIQPLLTGLAKVEGFEVINTDVKNAALIVLPSEDTMTKRALKNIPQLAVETVQNLDPVRVLTYKRLVFVDPQAAIDFLETKVNDNIATKANS